MSKLAERVLAFVRQNNGVRTIDVATHFGIVRNQAAHYLAELRVNEQVECEVKDRAKAGIWVARNFSANWKTTSGDEPCCYYGRLE